MRPPIIGLVSGLVVFLAGSAAWAQNPGRVLNGHRFIPFRADSDSIRHLVYQDGNGRWRRFRPQDPVP